MIAVLDASAAVKLVLDERHSDRMRLLWDVPMRMVAPTVVLPEVASAIDGARRAGRMDSPAARRAQRAWVTLSEEIDLLAVDPLLAATARDLAAARPVRGMDAVYLAVATRLAERSIVGLVSFDPRQRDVVQPDDGVHLLPATID